MDYKRKIDFAIKLLRSIPQDGPIELAYSGGKDSDVILELAKMSGIPFEPIYKNTTIDPVGTIAHCKENGVRIVQPKMTFFQIVEKKGIPTRWARFCCEILKEYKIHDRAILGIRREESPKRAARYKEPELCRLFGKGEKVRQYYPILEWTKEDCARFIEERGLKLAPCYYDEGGGLHLERRLGCVGCPLSKNNGRESYKENPKMLVRLVKSARIYLETHPETKAAQMFEGRAEDMVFQRLFCKTKREYEFQISGGLFPNMGIEPKQYLEDYFGVVL